MSEYVLVHGGNMASDAWNELAQNPVYPSGILLGGRVWDSIIPSLLSHGHHVFAPTLADEQTSSLSDHIEQILSIIEQIKQPKVILIAHSYGGMVITGAAARVPERIGRLVYVDAALPSSGQSLYDLIALAGCDAASFVGLNPDRPYVEKLIFDEDKIHCLPKTYVRCTQSNFAAVTAYVAKSIAEKGNGWTMLELPTSHVPMASMPGRFAQLLLEAAAT
ncbi:MAG: alpha/beta hydrolase [Deltaproteobacteria bacterium]